MKNSSFSLELLQEKIGAEYVERNPITWKTRIIRGLNEVWAAIDQHGGLSRVAALFGLAEAAVWLWIDDHEVPGLYAPYLAPNGNIWDLQLSSVGYQDEATGECWPRTWAMDAHELHLQSIAGPCGAMATIY